LLKSGLKIFFTFMFTFIVAFFIAAAAFTFSFLNICAPANVLAAGMTAVKNKQPAPFELSKPLNLIKAYEFALKRNHGYKASLYGKKASDDLAWEGLSVLLPRINVSFNYSRYDFVNPPPYYLSYDARNTSVSLTQPIFNMRRFFMYGQYKARASIGNARFESQKQNLIITVARAYLDVLTGQDYVKALKSQKKAVSSELKQAQKLYGAGAGTITDVYDARAKYYSVLSQLVGAKNDLKNAYAKFKNATGASGRNLVPFKRNIPFFVPRPSNVKYWVKVGARHNPMLKYYRDNRSYYTEGERKNIAAHFPTVSFVAGYSATNTQEYIQTPPLKYYNIGFQISIPLFNGGYGYAKTFKDANLESRAQQKYLGELNKNGRKIRQSYSNIKGSIVKIKMLELALKSARISLKGNELGFKSGIATETDVLDAVQALYDAKVKLLKAKYEYALGILNFYFNVGVLSKYNLAKINGWLK
jgi:TolC family type I secretion outer membrane protein